MVEEFESTKSSAEHFIRHPTCRTIQSKAHYCRNVQYLLPRYFFGAVWKRTQFFSWATFLAAASAQLAQNQNDCTCVMQSFWQSHILHLWSGSTENDDCMETHVSSQREETNLDLKRRGGELMKSSLFVPNGLSDARPIVHHVVMKYFLRANHLTNHPKRQHNSCSLHHRPHSSTEFISGQCLLSLDQKIGGVCIREMVWQKFKHGLIRRQLICSGLIRWQLNCCSGDN